MLHVGLNKLQPRVQAMSWKYIKHSCYMRDKLAFPMPSRAISLIIHDLFRQTQGYSQMAVFSTSRPKVAGRLGYFAASPKVAGRLGYVVASPPKVDGSLGYFAASPPKVAGLLCICAASPPQARTRNIGKSRRDRSDLKGCITYVDTVHV